MATHLIGYAIEIRPVFITLPDPIVKLRWNSNHSIKPHHPLPSDRLGQNFFDGLTSSYPITASVYREYREGQWFLGRPWAYKGTTPERLLREDTIATYHAEEGYVVPKECLQLVQTFNADNQFNAASFIRNVYMVAGDNPRYLFQRIQGNVYGLYRVHDHKIVHNERASES
jgi:hypothetical protein